MQIPEVTHRHAVVLLLLSTALQQQLHALHVTDSLTAMSVPGCFHMTGVCIAHLSAAELGTLGTAAH